MSLLAYCGENSSQWYIVCTEWKESEGSQRALVLARMVDWGRSLGQPFLGSAFLTYFRPCPHK